MVQDDLPNAFGNPDWVVGTLCLWMWSKFVDVVESARLMEGTKLRLNVFG
jgi:hypothetical protein